MLARLVFLLPAVGASLRLLGFKRTRDLLERFAPPPAQKRLDETSPFENANRIARLVGIAAQPRTLPRHLPAPVARPLVAVAPTRHSR